MTLNKALKETKERVKWLEKTLLDYWRDDAENMGKKTESFSNIECELDDFYCYDDDVERAYYACVGKYEATVDFVDTLKKLGGIE